MFVGYSIVWSTSPKILKQSHLSSFIKFFTSNSKGCSLMVEMEHYKNLSRYVKGQATKQFHHEMKKYFMDLAEELTLEEAIELNWRPSIKGWVSEKLFDPYIAEYLISAYSREGRLLVHCIYPKEAAVKIIQDCCEPYFYEIKNKRLSSAQLEYAKGLQNDLGTNLELPTENYFVFVATLKELIKLQANQKEQQKNIREQNFNTRLQADPATPKQLNAIQNSYNYFAKGKRRLDVDLLPHLSKYEVGIIFDLLKDGQPLERAKQVDSYLAELRNKWT